MPKPVYRKVCEADIPSLAQLRAQNRGTADYWRVRIAGYFAGLVNPQKALKPRALYVAVADGAIVGFIAGHLTRRFDCDGELEWIDVVSDYRGRGVSEELLRRLAAWFKDHKAARICVDVSPENTIARRFYRKHGAGDLNKHWLVWDDINVVEELARERPSGAAGDGVKFEV